MPIGSVQEGLAPVQNGGVIAYPTEAVFGLGCDPKNEQAVMRLLAIKQREAKQGVILIGSAFEQFADFIQPVAADMYEKIMARWPGPVTWLLPAAEDCPYWLKGEHETIAVRVTAHELTRQLCDACQMALVSTSANRHGEPAARTAAEVEQSLGDEVDLIIDGPTSGNANPSEIWDARTNKRLR